jgi:hypothetical protein
MNDKITNQISYHNSPICNVTICTFFHKLFYIQAQCSRKRTTLSIKTVQPIRNTQTNYLPLNIHLFTMIHAP